MRGCCQFADTDINAVIHWNNHPDVTEALIPRSKTKHVLRLVRHAILSRPWRVFWSCSSHSDNSRLTSEQLVCAFDARLEGDSSLAGRRLFCLAWSVPSWIESSLAGAWCYSHMCNINRKLVCPFIWEAVHLAFGKALEADLGVSDVDGCQGVIVTRVGFGVNR